VGVVQVAVDFLDVALVERPVELQTRQHQKVVVRRIVSLLSCRVSRVSFHIACACAVVRVACAVVRVVRFEGCGTGGTLLSALRSATCAWRTGR
jgi:hypothetical protein